MRNNIIIR